MSKTTTSTTSPSIDLLQHQRRPFVVFRGDGQRRRFPTTTTTRDDNIQRLLMIHNNGNNASFDGIINQHNPFIIQSLPPHPHRPRGWLTGNHQAARCSENGKKQQHDTSNQFLIKILDEVLALVELEEEEDPQAKAKAAAPSFQSPSK